MKSFGFVIFVFGVSVLHWSYAAVPTIGLCNEERSEHFLNETGYESALSVTLGKSGGGGGGGGNGGVTATTANSATSRGPCKLRVIGPETHIVSVSFVTAPSGGGGGGSGGGGPQTAHHTNTSNQNSTCMLSIYLPENRRKAVWKVDLCREGVQLPPARLLTPQMRVVWNPPTDAVPEFLSRTQLIITAIGKGDFCLNAGQHTCMQVGFNPVMCVADELLCDGIQHCPKDDVHSDEDPEMCTKSALHRTPWEYLAHELFKKISAHQRTNTLPAGVLEGNRWIHRNFVPHHPTTTPVSALTKDSDHNSKNNSSLERFSATISHYGPWGYLMMGMLICGTVLMFCGLWECCCRKTKQATPQLRRPPGGSTTRTTTVLIINPSLDEPPPTPGPPSYDELDQPPTYAALFPENKRNSLILNPGNLITRSNPTISAVHFQNIPPPSPITDSITESIPTVTNSNGNISEISVTIDLNENQPESAESSNNIKNLNNDCHINIPSDNVNNNVNDNSRNLNRNIVNNNQTEQ